MVTPTARFVAECGAVSRPLPALKRKWRSLKLGNVATLQETAKQAAVRAIRAKRVDVARWLVKALVHRLTTATRTVPPLELEHVLQAALKAGLVDVAAWLVETAENSWCLPSLLEWSTRHTTDCFCCAAKSGSLATVKFLHGLDGVRVSKAGDAAVYDACRAGALDVVQWFYEARPEWLGDVWSVSNAFMAACECPNAGAVDVVSWLWDKLCVLRATGPLSGRDKKSAMYKAVNFGHRDVVRFLFDVAGIAAHYTSPLSTSDVPFPFNRFYPNVLTYQMFEACLRDHAIVSKPFFSPTLSACRVNRWQQALHPGVPPFQIRASKRQLPASVVALVGMARAYRAFVMTAVLHWRRSSRAAFFRM